MIKFFIGLEIIIIYSFFIYAINKNRNGFVSLIALIVICTGCYYLGDMVMYRYEYN